MNFHTLSRTPNTEQQTPGSWLFALFTASALTCCSCTTMKSMARTEDFSEEIQRARQERPVQLAMNSTDEAPGVMRLAGKPQSEIQQVAYQEPYCPPATVSHYCPPEPRTPVAGPDPRCVGMPLLELANVPNPEKYCD